MLSLDVNVQEIAERYLNEAIAANTVENRGCAIVMDVKTGAILAMASKPDFDPNDPLNFTANEAYLNELVQMCIRDRSPSWRGSCPGKGWPFPPAHRARGGCCLLYTSRCV